MAARSQVCIAEVAYALKSGYFLVTGSTSVDGFPIIFLLDGVLPEPNVEEQRKALIYIASLPTLSVDNDVQYIFIIDRRKSTWSCVRNALSVITSSFYRLVKEVVLLEPSGFFQRKFGTESHNKLKQEYPFEIITQDVNYLVAKYGRENLCLELGGCLQANPVGFVQQRMSIDSLECNCIDLEDRVKSLLLVDARDDFDVPNDVASTEVLLNMHIEQKGNLSDEIANIKNQAQIISKCLQQEIAHLPPPLELLHVQEVQRLTARLEDLEIAVRDYWEKEEAKLQECMKLREFHDEFKALQHNLSKLSDALQNIKDDVLTSDEAASNTKRLSKLASDSQAILDRAADVAQIWISKMDTMDSITHFTVAPKCEELTRLHTICTDALQRKQKLADGQLSVLISVEDAQRWACEALALIVEPITDQSDESALTQRLKATDCHLAIGKFLDLLNTEEFLKSYRHIVQGHLERHVEEVHTKVVEVLAMIQENRSQLSDLITKLQTPNKPKGLLRNQMFGKISVKKKRDNQLSIHQVDSESTISSSSDAPEDKSFSRTLKTGLQKESRSETASIQSSNAERISVLCTPASPVSGPKSPSNLSSPSSQDASNSDMGDSSHTSLHRTPSRRSSMSDTIGITSKLASLSVEQPATLDSKSPRVRRGSIKAVKDIFSRSSKKQRAKSFVGVTEPANTLFDKALTLEEEALLTRMRKSLLDELVDGEAVYVRELQSTIECYMRPIASGGDSVSTTLYTNQAAIFANLEELADFHMHIFQHELKEYAYSPSLIGHCFTNRANEFSKYSQYCYARTEAQLLIQKLKSESFLAQCQQTISDKTSLTDLLLRPVHRILKYQQILKGIQSTLLDDEEARRYVTDSLTSIADIVKQANDVVSQAAISGYDRLIENLEQADQPTHGALLHQGKLMIYGDKKSKIISELRNKLKPRHVFVFEKCVVLCKEPKEMSRNHCFIFKSSIMLANSQLDATADQGCRFVLRSGSDSYVMQAEPSEFSVWTDALTRAMNTVANPDQTTPFQLSKPIPNARNSTKLARQRSYAEDIVVEEDPQVDIFNCIEEATVGHNDDPHKGLSSPTEKTSGSAKQYILMEDYDNDLLLGKGDVIECIGMKTDWMQVTIPGTGISGWLPANVLLPYS